MADVETLIAKLSKEAQPVKPMPHPVLSMLKWLAGSGLYLALLMVCFGLRGDVAIKLSSPLFLMEIGLLACMIVTSGLSAAVLSFPDLYQKRWAAFAPLLPFGLFCAVLALEWLEDRPPSPRPIHGVECLLCILCYSILPACWIFYHVRKMASPHAALAGFVALLGASSIGCLAQRLSEQTDSMVHLLQWHYLPMLALSIIGMGLGLKFLKW